MKCKSTANWICSTLNVEYQIPTDQIHGNSTQIQRNIALRKFKESAVRVLISTNVASRGLSLPRVDHVVQFDMPTHPEDFNSCVYRVGRAYGGRITSFYVPSIPGSETGNGRIYQLFLDFLVECKQVSFEFQHHVYVEQVNIHDHLPIVDNLIQGNLLFRSLSFILLNHRYVDMHISRICNYQILFMYS